MNTTRISDMHEQRASEMATLYKEGKTLEEIAALYQVSRERVRQIVSSSGITRHQGGKSVKSRIRKAREAQEKVRKHEERFHCTPEERKAIPPELRVSYSEQRRSARYLDKDAWKLNLMDWYDCWVKSGKIDQRGRSRNGYVLARIDKSKPFAPGNIHIVTLADNSAKAGKRRAGMTITKPRRRDFQGSKDPNDLTN